LKFDDLELQWNELFPPWFLWVGVALAAGVVTLTVLYYLEHPGRSPWDDFARVRIPDDVSSLAPSPSESGPESV
jgi:hypothetical protein